MVLITHLLPSKLSNAILFPLRTVSMLLLPFHWLGFFNNAVEQIQCKSEIASQSRDKKGSSELKSFMVKWSNTNPFKDHIACIFQFTGLYTVYFRYKLVHYIAGKILQYRRKWIGYRDVRLRYFFSQVLYLSITCFSNWYFMLWCHNLLLLFFKPRQGASHKEILEKIMAFTQY